MKICLLADHVRQTSGNCTWDIAPMQKFQYNFTFRTGTFSGFLDCKRYYMIADDSWDLTNSCWWNVTAEFLQIGTYSAIFKIAREIHCNVWWSLMRYTNQIFLQVMLVVMRAKSFPTPIFRCNQRSTLQLASPSDKRTQYRSYELLTAIRLLRSTWKIHMNRFRWTSYLVSWAI